MAIGASSPEALTPWTEAVATLGAQLVAARKDVLALIAPVFSASAESLGLTSAALSYEGEPVTPAEYEALQKTGWKVDARYRSGPLKLVVWPLLEQKEWGNKHEAPLDLNTVTAVSAQAGPSKTPERRAVVRRNDRPQKKGA